ncbi:MAG: molybdopterin molybdotransferase MoeA [bacterium]
MVNNISDKGKKQASDLLELTDKYIKKIKALEEVYIEDSIDRIFAADIIPEVNIPPFVRSAVDGFAVIAEDLSENKTIKLKVVQQITAGFNNKLQEIHHGEAAFVTTGAPVPPGADAVILIEDTIEYAGGYVSYDKKVEQGSYISPIGDDIKSDIKLYSKGDKIRLCDIAALAGIGYKKVSVFKKPVIGILSGGNELIQPGDELKSNKIYDINTTALKALIKDAGGIPEVIGVVEDNTESITNALITADKSQKYNLLISTGGTGASFLVLDNKEITNFYDLIPSSIKKAGKLYFHGLNLIPGKPTSFGILNENTPIFALAGWPYSVIITFDLFVRPFIQKMTNINNIYKRYPEITAVLKEEVRSEKGVRKYFQVKITKGNNKLTASVIQPPKPPSAARSLSPLIKANGSFAMDEETVVLHAGEEVIIALNDYNIF